MELTSAITLHSHKGHKGPAEALRFLLKYGKKQFTDNMLDEDAWTAFKSKTPLGQLPIIEYTNKEGKSVMVTQAAVQIRGLARLLGLNGKNEETALRADEAFECMREIMEQGARALHETDDVRKYHMQKQIQSELLPRNFAYLERRATANGGKSVANPDHVTYADVVLAVIFDEMNNKDKEQADRLKGAYPALATISNAILQDSEIKTHIRKRSSLLE